MEKATKFVAWVWVIIVGGLMIAPDGIVCTACGRNGTLLLGVVSVLVGAVAFATPIVANRPKAAKQQ